MKIVRIKGGIGNQLFQYAFGIKLSNFNAEIKFDLSDYDIYTKKDKFGVKYRLDKFNTNMKIATEQEILKIKGKEKKSKLNNKIMYNFGLLSKIYRMFYWRYDRIMYTRRRVIIEKPYKFKTQNVKDNKYFDGYWAKYKYFEDIRDFLLKKLKLNNEYQTNKYKELKERIANQENSISVHLRKWGGDKAKEANHEQIELDVFGVLPFDYYIKAVRYIEERINNPNFYIFSDDIEWAKKNLKINDNHKFINLGSEGDYLELKLMSYCKHNIIANSTFSWWSAWLNENPDKIVIAPKRWYNNLNFQKQYEKNHFIPKEWIKL